MPDETGLGSRNELDNMDDEPECATSSSANPEDSTAVPILRKLEENVVGDDSNLSLLLPSGSSTKYAVSHRPEPSQQQQQLDGDPDTIAALSEVEDDGADHAEPPATPWKPQNILSTCEFTHTIGDYAAKRESGCKKAEYSATTVDDSGNRWRLIVYVNGNGRASNHHLSLFLQVADAEELPFGWKKAVSYVLTLEHPNTGNLSYAKRNPDKTFKLCPKAIDWGWSQFITSDRIQQEGFVSDDTLTVRASVTVKSSSVSIDEDDSELYLKCAVEEGDAEAVKLCLEQGAKVNCQFKDDEYTPLHTACSSGTNTGSMEVLNLLLEKGADGNACNKWSETPLLIAANNGHRAAVEALLKHGADPSLCSEAGWSALTFAAHKGYEDIVVLLLRAGAPVNSLVSEDSSTPLHKACAGSKAGHLEAVKFLLAGGADVHALNKWRETPLLTAANHGQAGAVEALLNSGADPCRCTDTGWSPLSIAAYKGHDDVVRLLLEEGAPTEEDDPTLSALLQAATKGLPDTVELLLRHGADHTVTTKKGDTALSILVEQNLIDAAVEMVTKYNASIPRCSRDRKKVQRARLLIQLRTKQRDEECMEESNGFSTDDGETDDEDQITSAQHADGAGVSKKTLSKKKKKNKTPKLSEVEKAKAAEEALLQELEREESKAKKEEAEANSKRAKKKKKKERERQQKMQEEQERREQEEREAQERERLKREKEQKERERLLKQKRERDKHELAEREKLLEAKRQDRDRHERDQKHRLGQETQSDSPLSPTNSVLLRRKPSTNVPAIRSSFSAKSSTLSGNRRWETKPKTSSDAASSSDPGQLLNSLSNTYGPSDTRCEQPEEALTAVRTQSCAQQGQIELLPTPTTGSRSPEATTLSDASMCTFESKDVASTTVSSHSDSPVSLPSDIEHPTVSLFRRDKLLELIHRCSLSSTIVDGLTVKRAIYRWTTRASHSDTLILDPIIPSWVDLNQLVSFFQRQFISEGKRGLTASTMSMEALKDDGTVVARLCHTCALETLQFRQRVQDQLPNSWDDSALGMSVVENIHGASTSLVSVSWANRSSVAIPTSTFSILRKRYTGPPSRFLATVFVSKIWYESLELVADGTAMDIHLSPRTKACLSDEFAVSAELWCDPFNAHGNNVFWGKFDLIDTHFGGQKPFGKDDKGGEEVLARYGSSVSVLLPFDNMVASRYMKRMLDIIDLANASRVPVSFTVFVHSDSFQDGVVDVNQTHLTLLDQRFTGEKASYIRWCEALSAGQHTFGYGRGAEDSKLCHSGSMIVFLQSESGKSRYSVNDHSIERIIQTMSVNGRSENAYHAPIGFQNDFISKESPLPQQSVYFEHQGARSQPLSPGPQQSMQTVFGAIGRDAVVKPPSSDGVVSRLGARRGRLFDLVDDGEEDQLNDVDIVSGMLNNLDVGLFQSGNAGSDIDIEAISLMGIGGPPRSQPPGNSHPGRFFG
jgi:ankyrin repeat protein